MRKKHVYRSIEIHQVTVAQVLEWIVTPLVLLALDVAKRRVLVALADAMGTTARLVHFAMPGELAALVGLADALAHAGRTVQVVLEPTGTYGDPIAECVHRAGHAVFLVSPKRTHDACEVFDGVPSKHDPKDAVILARLHAQRLSRAWSPQPETRRELRALIDEREIYAVPLETLLARVEAFCARWWPGLTQAVDLRTRISVQRWLTEYPDPALVRADPAKARERLRRLSRSRLEADVLDRVIASAIESPGAAMTSNERTMMRVTFEEIVRLRARCDDVEARIATTMSQRAEHAPLVSLLAPVTTAVVLAYVGDPAQYANARAFEKACGLNLKESSSGEHQGRLRITKRGPGRVRRYLFLLALRTIAGNNVARAWYQQRQGFREEHKLPAVIALMRKLAKAIWHVARGADFDATKLFDVRRLHRLTATASGPVELASGGATTT